MFAAALVVAYLLCCWLPCEMLRRETGRFPAGVFALNVALGWTGLWWIAFMAFSAETLRSTARG